MSTTGTLSSGTDFTGLSDALKQRYTGPFATNIEGEMEVTGVFQDAGDFETTDGPDGAQINLGHYISAGGGISFATEDDYLPDSVPPVWKQSNITIKKLLARVDLSGNVLRRVKQGPAAFADWAQMALPERAKGVAWHKDRALLGTGTGVIGQVNGTPDGTGDALNNAFGISGLEGALNLIRRGDSLRYATTAAGTTKRTGVVVVDAIDYNASTFNSTVAGSTATATSAASGDFVFLGSANVTSNGTREIMGLEGIIDDGTNLSTFQGLTRASYPDVMNAQVVDSTTQTVAASGVLSETLIDYAAALAYERAGGKTNVILVNRSGQRSFWASLKSDRVINDPQGQFTGGRADLKMIVGNQIISVKAARKVPSSRAYLIDTSSMKRFKIGEGHWDDTTGSVWRQVVDSTGVKDAVFAYFVEEVNYASIHPARNAKITKLVAA